jgi:glycine oxidase
MLAPSVERHSDSVDAFGVAARDRYPSYLEFLRDRTGIAVPLNRSGILQVALSDRGVKGLRRGLSSGCGWLDRDELMRLEPSLSHALGAVHNPLDGSVDNVALTNALTLAVEKSDRITILRDRVTAVRAAANGISASTSSSDSLSASHVVIAAGAWSGTIEGAPLARAVTPAKGQLISYSAAPLHHVVYGPRGYLVPRGASTIGGSTTERTGFDSSTSDEGIAKVKAAAEEICPALTSKTMRLAWAGLRPVTPDALPLIGPDPESPAIIYACGHGRNGILMAPLTGDLVADLVTGSPLPYDLEQFRPERF